MKKQNTKIKPMTGWVLVYPDDDGGWYVCWMYVFDKKKDALAFAKDAGWLEHKAVRGQLSASNEK